MNPTTSAQAKPNAQGAHATIQPDHPNFDLATFIQHTVRDAVSSAVLGLRTTRTPFNTVHSNPFQSATVTKKQKAMLLTNFKRILNTTFELQRHIAYNNLAQIRTHSNASKLIEQYNIAADGDPQGAQKQALRSHLDARSRFLDTLVTQQHQFIERLKQRGSNSSLEQLLNDAFNRAANETAPTSRAIWSEVFQFATNAAIHGSHEQLRSAQPAPQQQQQIDETLRLNQLRNIYQRRVNQTREHLNKGTLPVFLEKQRIHLPSNHKNLAEVTNESIETEWQHANFEAQRILLYAANRIFNQQLTRTEELIQDLNANSDLTSQIQGIQGSIIKLKLLRSRVTSDPSTIPLSFANIFTRECEPINKLDDLLALFQNESDHADIGSLIAQVKSQFNLSCSNSSLSRANNTSNQPIRNATPTPGADHAAAPNGSTNQPTSQMNDIFDDESDPIVVIEPPTNGPLKRTSTNLSSSDSQGTSGTPTANTQRHQSTIGSQTNAPRSPKTQRKH